MNYFTNLPLSLAGTLKCDKQTHGVYARGFGGAGTVTAVHLHLIKTYLSLLKQVSVLKDAPLGNKRHRRIFFVYITHTAGGLGPEAHPTLL